MSTNDKKTNFWLKLKKPILALAPMAGITDSAFRQICKKYGADVVYTEMISADGLFYDAKKTLAMLNFHKSEQPVVIQIILLLDLIASLPAKLTIFQQVPYKALLHMIMPLVFTSIITAMVILQMLVKMCMFQLQHLPVHIPKQVLLRFPLPLHLVLPA